MNGKRTCIVLGAGASFCYEKGKGPVPHQANIIGRMFSRMRKSSGLVVGTVILGSGMQASYPLAEYLRELFGLKQQTQEEFSDMDVFNMLQKKGFTLESLYKELEGRVLPEEHWVLDHFEAIVRTAVTEPLAGRLEENVCQYHRALAESLEPGDYIIDFNWDSVMSDALYYRSHLWFPYSGLGFSNVNVLCRSKQKQIRINSPLQLFHIHGSVSLYEMADRQDDSHCLLYVGPQSYAPGNTIMSAVGIEPKQDRTAMSEAANAPKELSPRDQERCAVGFLHFDGHWFKPIFTPPSYNKISKDHWYMEHLRSVIHSLLPTTRQIVIAGYSFPEADHEHLSRIFVRDIISRKTDVRIINLANSDDQFRGRVGTVFSNMPVDYSCADFKEFCTVVDQ